MGTSNWGSELCSTHRERGFDLIGTSLAQATFCLCALLGGRAIGRAFSIFFRLTRQFIRFRPGSLIRVRSSACARMHFRMELQHRKYNNKAGGCNFFAWRAWGTYARWAPRLVFGTCQRHRKLLSPLNRLPVREGRRSAPFPHHSRTSLSFPLLLLCEILP